MVEADTLVWSLLIGRTVALIFMIWVVKTQFSLFKYYIPPHIKTFRRALFALGIFILLQNLIAFGIDVAVLANLAEKASGKVSVIGVIYTLTNMATSVSAAIILGGIYVMALRSLEEDEEE